jgi:hypothetical protein
MGQKRTKKFHKKILFHCEREKRNTNDISDANHHVNEKREKEQKISKKIRGEKYQR